MVKVIKRIKVLSFRAITALKQALRRSRLNWNLILLLATLGTTLWAGYQFSLPLVEKRFVGESMASGGILFLRTSGNLGLSRDGSQVDGG